MKKSAVLYVSLAALCYGLSTPMSKLLMGSLLPTMLAALLYLGAGIGMVVLFGKERTKEAKLTKKSCPFPSP